MATTSSIHIEAGNLGYLFHNSREKHTNNRIFFDEENEISHSAKDALKIYREELAKRTRAYTARTGKKLHKKTITHLSAIVNLERRHTLKDLERLKNYLEESLGTKVFQIAIHKDEGHIDERGEAVKNYHAHIEFLGIDENGNSVRRKLTRTYLRELQTRTADILGMQRGQKNSKRRRLDTYEYKEHAKRKAQSEKEALAKIKDLNEINKRLRAQLQELHARREHYAKLEALVKELKSRIKAKELSKRELEKRLNAQIDELKSEIDYLHDVQYKIANAKTLARVLEILANSKNYHVCEAVAYNENTPPEALKTLARIGDSILRKIIAENPNTPPETLKTLANDEDVQIREAVALNPNTAPETLKTLANDENAQIRYVVALNEKTPSEALETLANSKSAKIREAVALNPNTPPETLETLANDENAQIREAVANNDNAFFATLSMLCKDENKRIREIAMRTYERKEKRVATTQKTPTSTPTFEL
jgi:hypothetical protein